MGEREREEVAVAAASTLLVGQGLAKEATGATPAPAGRYGCLRTTFKTRTDTDGWGREGEGRGATIHFIAHHGGRNTEHDVKLPTIEGWGAEMHIDGLQTQ